MNHIIAVNRPGERGWIAPGSDQHLAMISPSKVGAILGLSRWESPYSLWCRMKGLIPGDEPKDAYDLGHDIEPFAANRWRRKNPGWLLSPGEVQFVVDPEHFGFPAMATLDRRAVRGRSRRVVEFKMARDQNDADKWGDDLSGDLPADYWTQVLVAMLFTGWTDLPGQLLAIGPRLGDERVYEVVYDADAKREAAFIIEECRSFYRSLSGSEPPELDDSEATYQTVRAQHPDIEKGAEVELTPELAEEFLSATADLKDLESAARLAKTRVLDVMKSAQYARCNGTLIARRQPSSRGSVALFAAKGAK
ncbi:RecE like protein [Mycobacterium phage 32HC]|uniref:RecE like protein n=1 Tax=Mycobacterium phage 32HC TaxID=1445729 RepID=W8ECD3_9CAUD|nr:RecE-like recombination exonuclease [Mycobacterium phage 32HC]AHJ86332.1 RecE like protein [Mycobacterium phage 32HC]